MKGGGVSQRHHPTRKLNSFYYEKTTLCDGVTSKETQERGQNGACKFHPPINGFLFHVRQC